MTDERRRAELAAALDGVRARIASSCAAAGRDRQSVMLVAVTKTYPVTDVAALIELGVRDIGESRDQEAKAKVAELSAAPVLDEAVRWHVVGRLQTNKARSVVGYAAAVHSVDRIALVTALADASGRRRSDRLDIFVQISLDGDPDRGGVALDGVAELADAVAAREELVLRGVMAVPPMGSDPHVEFARLAEIGARVRESHPGADAISAGMSADLESAVQHGSTHVRVGSALLGRRAALFG